MRSRFSAGRGVGFFFLALTALFAHNLPAQAQGAALPKLQVSPAELRWMPAPPGGFPYAMVLGDPTRTGPYVVRGRFPAGFRVEPHSHPDPRVVMVLSGTVLVGYGEVFDESQLKAMPAGSVWTEPANQPHFAWARDGEAEIQAVGQGPSATLPAKR